MNKIPLGLQLYTVRDLTRQDFVGTVKQVAGIGYAGVELAGWGNLSSAAEAKRALDDVGLKVFGAHAGIEALEADPGKVLDEADVFGNKLLVIPSIPAARRKDATSWKSAAQSMTRCAAECRKRGIELAYHNHAFEFDKVEGKSGFDLLWENSDPKTVKSELDVYWVQYGGEDPIAWIRKLGKRLTAVHLKDMAAGPERRFAPVGSGILDTKAIIEAAQQAGATTWIVEQDNTFGVPPLEAVKTSYENLRKMGAI